MGQGRRDARRLDPAVPAHAAGHRDREPPGAAALRQDPKRALDLIRNRLGLQFDHEREQLDPAANLPSKLDPALLDRQRLIKLGFSRNPNTVEDFEDAALDWLMDTR